MAPTAPSPFTASVTPSLEVEETPSLRISDDWPSAALVLGEAFAACLPAFDRGAFCEASRSAALFVSSAFARAPEEGVAAAAEAGTSGFDFFARDGVDLLALGVSAAAAGGVEVAALRFLVERGDWGGGEAGGAAASAVSPPPSNRDRVLMVVEATLVCRVPGVDELGSEARCPSPNVWCSDWLELRRIKEPRTEPKSEPIVEPRTTT